MKVTAAGSHASQTRAPAAAERSVRMAMMVKARDAQKAEGEAALKLIEARPDRAPPPAREEDTGSRVDRYA